MATTLSLGLREALTMLRAGLEAIYGDRLAGLRLYGSQARGDARTDSDVDLAVLLEGPIVNGAGSSGPVCYGNGSTWRQD